MEPITRYPFSRDNMVEMQLIQPTENHQPVIVFRLKNEDIWQFSPRTNDWTLVISHKDGK